jgi:hypothetical protein
MKNLYLILKVIDHNGLRFPGEQIELTEEQAKNLPVRMIERQPEMETADLHLENIETADAKPVRKGRDHAHPARKQ